MTSRSRTRRGRETERLVAARLQVLYPEAEAVAASRAGRDVLRTPGLAAEVKATAGVDLTGWLRQAIKNAQGDLPTVYYRPKGYGPESIDEWPVIRRVKDDMELLKKAGYRQ